MLSRLLNQATHLITQSLFFVFLAGAIYGIVGEDALPGSGLFAVLVLAVCAFAGGRLVGLFRLPPLVGMLIVGVLYRNLPFIRFSEDISTKSASSLRDVSLAVILLKAGLGLDAQKLKILKKVVFRLSFVPCVLEAITSALASRYLLGLPWLWASMLGFILSAVSAAVLVPGALSLEENRLGTVQGVPTLLMASVSLDNITALTGFIVIFNVLTSNENVTWTFCKRLLEPFVGLLLGATLGIVLWYFPNKENSDRPTVIYYRTALLCLGGLAFTFVSKKFRVSGVGALGCVSLAFFASLRWRNDFETFKSIAWVTGILWYVIEPFLFGLIGTEISLSSLQNNVGYGTLVLFLGVSIRFLSTVLALLGSSLDFKEKLFVSASWISKATVQAAVGSQTLDFGETEGRSQQFQEYGNQVLTMSALSILLTAPLGAALMDILGERLLKKEATDEGGPTAEHPQKSSLPEIQISTHYGSCSTADTHA